MTPELERVAVQVAARYRRRCWWADVDDLKQTARLACWEASRTWDPNHGAPLPAYAWRAAVLAVRRYLWRASAPVSASDHYLTELRGLHRRPEGMLADHSDPAPWPDRVLSLKRWREAVYDQIELLLLHDVRHGGSTIDEAMAAARVALDDEAPKDVAADSGLPIAQVYKARRRLRLLVLHSLRCYELAKELP